MLHYGGQVHIVEQVPCRSQASSLLHNCMNTSCSKINLSCGIGVYLFFQYKAFKAGSSYFLTPKRYDSSW